MTDRLGFIVVLLLCLGGVASATDKVAAQQAFDAGAKYYDTAQFDKALEAFQRAYFDFEEPNILYNIAQCHRALGHKKEAIDTYRSYLRKARSAPNRPEVERIIADLEARLEAERAKAAPLATAAPPAPVDTTVAEVVTPAPPSRRPVYKRGWFWGVVAGSVAVIGLGVGLGVGLTRSHDPRSDGTVTF